MCLRLPRNTLCDPDSAHCSKRFIPFCTTVKCKEFQVGCLPSVGTVHKHTHTHLHLWGAINTVSCSGSFYLCFTCFPSRSLSHSPYFSIPLSLAISITPSIRERFRCRIFIWASLLQHENNGHFCRVDTFFIKENQVLNVIVDYKLTNFRSLFKTKIHYKFAFLAVLGNSQ